MCEDLGAFITLTNNTYGGQWVIYKGYFIFSEIGQV